MAGIARLHKAELLAQIDSLSAVEEIPSNYLGQILTDLRNGGLIISKRGKQGGYTLARTPEEISLWDIVFAVDRDCLINTFKEVGQSGAKVASLWRDFSAYNETALRALRLSDLVTDDCEDMYYI